MNLEQKRQRIGDFLGFALPAAAAQLTTHQVDDEDGYRRARVSYLGNEGERIPAYLLLPGEEGPFAGVVVHHQHHGQRHWGKSEVCGLVGDPWQAFGPALARRGLAVLAPDSICFEDRRRNRQGTEPDPEDVAQHYNELCYRLVRGKTLMEKVLADSALALSVLREHPLVDAGRIGMLGHSYGGSTVLFHAPLDERVAFACASGSACSYQHRMAHETGIEMSQVIPGFAASYDLADLMQCMTPRRLLIVSASQDPFSMDAAEMVAQAGEAYLAAGAAGRLEHLRFDGEHALTEERFERIVGWMVAAASN